MFTFHVHIYEKVVLIDRDLDIQESRLELQYA